MSQITVVSSGSGTPFPSSLQGAQVIITDTTGVGCNIGLSPTEILAYVAPNASITLSLIPDMLAINAPGQENSAVLSVTIHPVTNAQLPSSKAVGHQTGNQGFANSGTSGQSFATSYGWRTQVWFPNGASTVGVVWQGSIKMSSSLADHKIAKAMTLQSFIEYPSGTYTQIFYNGQPSAVLQPGAILESDEVPVDIPVGAQGWIHTYVSNMLTTDTLAYNYVTNDYSILGVQVAQEGSMTAPTVPQAIANSSFSKVLIPSVIKGRPLSLTPTKSVILIGDSAASGTKDCGQGWASMPNSALGILNLCVGPYMRGWAGVVPFTQQTIPGALASQLLGINSTAGLYRFHDVIVFQPGMNDIAGNSATFANMQSYCLDAANRAKAAGCIFVACTIPPLPTFGGTQLKPFITGTGFTQTVSSYQPIVNQYNAWLKSNPLGIDLVIDIANVIDPKSTGLWPVVSPIYSGTGNIVQSGGSAVITDTGTPSWTNHQWSNPADGLGPYMVYLPVSVTAFPVWDNTSNTVTVTTTTSQYPSAPTGTGTAYEIIDLWTYDANNPLPRVVTAISNEVHAVLGNVLNY